jgi:hypothetical protein
MARIRTVKPEFWDDEKLAKFSLQANLIYIGTWNFSDDSGIIRRNANWIKSKIFPHREELRLSDVKVWIKELEDAGIIVPFNCNNEGYYLIPTFKVHQRIDKPQKSKIPVEIQEKVLSDYSKNDPRTVQDYYTREWNGMEGKGGEDSTPEFIMVKDLKITNCKMPPESMDYKVVAASINLYKGFLKYYPNNKDLEEILVKDWVPHVRALMQKKGYTYEQIKEVASWAFQEKFWKDVVLDMEKLESNFEKIKIQYQNGKSKAA